ncbi:MAG: protein-glutamate O-methyltransferase CheR [Synoicihabitans sp.]
MTPDFEAVLKLHMGLDAASIGSASVDRAVQRRRAICGVVDDAGYFDLLMSSPEEIQELIETVAVPETWFFRDPEAFTALVKVVRDEWLPKNPHGIFRVANIPCSTGEEPYSVVMALIDAGIPDDRFRVDAIDISLRSLRVAEKGVYGRNSFRGRGLEYRERFFEQVQGGWRLTERVKAKVSFRHGNILSPKLASDESLYDAVFCRNLLIYFDLETQVRALASIKRILKRDGWFFAGPSETGVAVGQGFVSARIPLAFAFRRQELMPAAAQLRSVPVPEWKRAPIPTRKPRPRPPAPQVKAQPAPVTASSAKTPFDAMAEVSRAARLADTGNLVEAASLCERIIEQEDTHVQAFYVLALVRDAAGKPADAISLYRKVLYLDPRHHEAMSQLSVLLKAHGRESEAALMRERARRLQKTEEAPV